MYALMARTILLYLLIDCGLRDHGQTADRDCSPVNWW